MWGGRLREPLDLPPCGRGVMGGTGSWGAGGARFPGRPRGCPGPGGGWALRDEPPMDLGPPPCRPEADPGHWPGGLRALPHVHGRRPAAAPRAEVVPLRQRRGHLRHVRDRDVHRRAGGTARARVPGRRGWAAGHPCPARWPAPSKGCGGRGDPSCWAHGSPPPSAPPDPRASWGTGTEGLPRSDPQTPCLPRTSWSAKASPTAIAP